MTEQFDSLGMRYRYEVYPNEDHLVWLNQDNLTTAANYLDGTVQADPGHITLTWYPDLTVPKWGIGTNAAWWISGVASDAPAGSNATVDAVSHAKPDPVVTTHEDAGPAALADGTPGVYRQQTWTTGARPAAQNSADLTLTAVKALTVDTARAGLTSGAVINVHSDRDVTVTLSGPGARSVHLAAGDHTITV